MFHGSPIGTIEELEPRQSYSFNEPDGEPAISASATSDPAVFMALFSKSFGSAMGTYPTEENPFGMVVSQSAWNDVHSKDTKGYVYVLDAKDFTPRSQGEWELRATKRIKPLAIIEVSADDVPNGVVVKADNEVMEYLNEFRSSVS